MQKVLSLLVLVGIGLTSSNSFATEDGCLEIINESNTPIEQNWALTEEIDLDIYPGTPTIFKDRTSFGKGRPGCYLDHNWKRKNNLLVGKKLKVSIKFQPQIEKISCKAEGSSTMSSQQLENFCINYIHERVGDYFFENFKFKQLEKDSNNADNFEVVFEGAKQVYVEIKNVENIFGFACYQSLKNFKDLKNVLPVTGIKCPESK